MTAPTLSEPRPDDEGRTASQSVDALLSRLEDEMHFHLDQPVRGDFMSLTRGWREILTAALTPHPAPLGATDEGRDMADRLCECGHAESGHVESGWWTGSDIACVVCYDGQGGNTAVPPCKRFRAALQATP